MASFSTGKAQSPNSFIIFDFETGGVDSRKNPATEIALIAIKGDSTLDEIGRFQELIRPYDRTLAYEEKAAKVSGISVDLIEDEGKDLLEVVDGVIELLKAANNCFNTRNSPGLRPVLVGHNVGFDIGFLHHIFDYRFKGERKTNGQNEMEALLHGRRDYYGNFQPSYIDTWSLSKMWFGGEEKLPNYQLGTVIEEAGVELSDAHRAMNDVIATTDLFRAVVRNLRSGYGFDSEGNSLKSRREGFHFPI